MQVFDFPFPFAFHFSPYAPPSLLASLVLFFRVSSCFVSRIRLAPGPAGFHPIVISIVIAPDRGPSLGDPGLGAPRVPPPGPALPYLPVPWGSCVGMSCHYPVA